MFLKFFVLTLFVFHHLNLKEFSFCQEHDWGDTTTAVTGLSDLAFPPGGHTEEDVSSSGRVGGANSRLVAT